jgi:hypothetical protein
VTCDNCNVKMDCRYSVPTGSNSRYRMYRCPACRVYKTSCEIEITVLRHPEIWPELERRIEEARKAHFRTCRMMSRKRKKALAAIG